MRRLGSISKLLAAVFCAFAIGGGSAVAAPIALAPGQTSLFNINATAYTYSSFRIFADVTDAALGDFVAVTYFGGLDQTDYFGMAVSGADVDANDGIIGSGAGAMFSDGLFSLLIGTDGFSISSLTFDDVRIVFSSGSFEGPIATFSLPTASVPGTFDSWVARAWTTYRRTNAPPSWTPTAGKPRGEAIGSATQEVAELFTFGRRHARITGGQTGGHAGRSESRRAADGRGWRLEHAIPPNLRRRPHAKHRKIA